KPTTTAFGIPQQPETVAERGSTKWLIATLGGVVAAVLVVGSFIAGKFLSRGEAPPPVAVAASIARPAAAPVSTQSIVEGHHQPASTESITKPASVAVAPTSNPALSARAQPRSDVPTSPAASDHPDEPTGHGQLTAKTLHTLKDATVFVKVEAGP